MKTITLRTLLREPRKVKRITHTGESVEVTERGETLWVIQPAVREEDEKKRRREVEAELDEIAKGPKMKIPLSKIILESRR